MVASIEDQLSATIKQMENTLQTSGQQLGAMFGEMGSQMEQTLAPATASIEHFQTPQEASTIHGRDC